ncbi:MAG TPA: recombinase A, partial [Candidatus Krumholzibacteria bacterium]|nr:recombinase A [Candidatus Krumholzibacteria bacterium]
VQSRLSGLANTHLTAVVCLTRKKTDSLSIGSLVSIRGQTAVERHGFDQFEWAIDVIKDKRRGPGWRHAGACRGPEGLH